MAALIVEPASTNPETVDWQALLSKLVKICGGAINTARLTEWDTTGNPQVAAGSRFEVNGSFYECAVDESISGWTGISDGADAYVYATPGTGEVLFSYSSTAPTWDSAKGGWYNGTARALFKMLRTNSTTWTNKERMDEYDAFTSLSILKRLLTVDGAGSLLDADLHDGAQKVTSIIASTADDSSIPTEKAVADYVSGSFVGIGAWNSAGGNIPMPTPAKIYDGSSDAYPFVFIVCVSDDVGTEVSICVPYSNSQANLVGSGTRISVSGNDIYILRAAGSTAGRATLQGLGA